MLRAEITFCILVDDEVPRSGLHQTKPFLCVAVRSRIHQLDTAVCDGPGRVEIDILVEVLERLEPGQMAHHLSPQLMSGEQRFFNQVGKNESTILVELL